MGKERGTTEREGAGGVAACLPRPVSEGPHHRFELVSVQSAAAIHIEHEERRLEKRRETTHGRFKKGVR